MFWMRLGISSFAGGMSSTCGRNISLDNPPLQYGDIVL